MTVSWYGFLWHQDAGRRLSAEDERGLTALLRGLPGLTQARLYVAVDAGDVYFNDDGPGPAAAIQLEAATVGALEALLAPHAPLQKLADADFLPSLAGGLRGTQQGMVTRKFPVAEPVVIDTTTELCSFLVEYPGRASDFNAWLGYYVENHPRYMAKFPGLRQAEVDSPAVLVSSLPFAWATPMQRNKVVFDSPAALSAGTNSPAIREMRADFARFPPFTGNNLHYPMRTLFPQPETGPHRGR